MNTLPRQIAHYSIESELGRGWMAAVYRATDTHTGRAVAIKLLPPEFMQGPSDRTRWEREAKAIAGLKHPAIVPLLDHGQEGTRFYYVLRLMAGGALPARLRRGPLTLAEAGRVMSRIGGALEHAHSRGVIHRNLRAGAILYDEDGAPYLSDFGIVTLPEVAREVPQSAVMNALAYMPPEQIQRQDIDGRADVYALGVIAFEMLTGQLPYQAHNPQALAGQHLAKPVPGVLDTLRAARLEPNVPGAVEGVVARAMAKAPGERFASAGEMVEAWSAAVGERASQPAPAVAVETAGEPAAPQAGSAGRRGGNLLWGLVVGGLAVAALALVAVVLSRVLGLGSSGGEAQPLTQTHQSAALGYSMQMPDGWVARDTSSFGLLGGGVLVTIAAQDRATYDALSGSIEQGTTGLTGPGMLVMTLPLDDAPVPIIMPRVLLSLFTEGGPVEDTRYTRIRSTRVDGRRAAYADMTAQEGEVEIGGRVVAVAWSGQVGYVVGVAPSDQWDAFAPTFEAMLGSMTLTTPTGAPEDLGQPVIGFEVLQVGADTLDGYETGAEWSIRVNGGPSQWELAAGPVADSWLFEGSAGQSVTITMRAGEEGFDPYATLFGPDGAWVDADDDSGGGQWGHDASLRVTLPQSGRYTVRATEYWGEGGVYTLSISSP